MWRNAILMTVFTLLRTVHADPCATNPCQNGATCEPASYDSSTFQCTLNCPSNCYGKQCDVCAATSSVCASCLPGFTQAIPGSCFKVVSGSYDATNAYCTDLGGKIATINDAAEDYAIRSWLTTSNSYYGMTGWGDPNSVGTFQWADGSASTHVRCSGLSTGYCCVIQSFIYGETTDWWQIPCTSSSYGGLCRAPCGSDPCGTNPCQNGATCEIASYDGGTYQCKTNCPSNCYGKRCEVCAPTSSVCASCLPGFTQAIPGSCFKVASGNSDATNAYCTDVGGKIATINSAAEDYAIRNWLTTIGTYQAMIGWGDQNSVGTFQWADGSASTYLRCSGLSTGYCCILPNFYYGEYTDWWTGPCTSNYGGVCRAPCGSDICTPNPCQNGATCESSPHDSSTFQCKTNCPSNCYGKRCEVCVPTSSMCASCPTGFTQAVPGSCFSKLPGNFPTANTNCAGVGGKLATINDAAEDYALRSWLATTNTYYGFIGYGDPSSVGTFQWVDGSSSTYLRCSGLSTGYCCNTMALMYGEYSDWWVSPCTADYYGGGICKAPCGTDQCASNPCQNGATCERSPYDAASYQCKSNCPSNCYGQQCEVCVPATSVCVAGCPAGFTQVIPGSCFSILTGNFQTADASCVSSGGRIATINDAAEDYQIRSWLATTGQSHAMTGWGDQNSAGTFQWADGSASTYVRCSGLSTGYCCLIPSLSSSASGDWELGSCATDYGAAVCKAPCEDPCVPDPCQNGATCEPATYDATTFQCKLNCPSNCYGKQCDVCAAAASVCPSCLPGFEQAIPGSCFKVVSGNYASINTYCGDVGGKIATINDAAEDYAIRSWFSTIGTYYTMIGYGDPSSVGTFQWADGSASSYVRCSGLSTGYCCVIPGMIYGETSDWWQIPCTANYYGGLCRAPCGSDICTPNPCQNGATCEPSTYDSSTFQCKTNCPSNCYGKRCEVCIPTTSMCASCPTGFTQAIPGSCFSKLPGNFPTANTNCAGVGGKLATINDAAEDNAIRNWLTTTNTYYGFIGYGDPSSVGTFQWVDGSASTYLRCYGLSTGYCCNIAGMMYGEYSDWWVSPCTADYYGGGICKAPCGTDQCASNPCQNGATCEASPYDASSYQCKLNCPSNCYGQQCEVCVPTSSVCVAGCPPGFTQSVPGSCFSVLTGNFQTADASCTSSGGRIATINDAAEDYQIRSWLTAIGQSHAMIGYGDPSSVGTFQWADGSASTYVRCSGLSTGYCCLIPSIASSASGDWELGSCATDYGAAVCRTPCFDPCTPDPCQNGATCEPASYDTTTFQCKLNCPSNCYGKQCDVCVAAASVCETCPAGFTQVVPGSCYSALSGDFQTTDTDCGNNGGRIATINDAAEDYQIRSWFTTVGTYYALTGYGDPNSVGTFQWADGSASTYLRCYASNIGYCCLIPSFMYGETSDWFEVPCSSYYGGLCKAPCGEITVCFSHPGVNGGLLFSNWCKLSACRPHSIDVRRSDTRKDVVRDHVCSICWNAKIRHLPL